MVEKLPDGYAFTPHEYGVIKCAWTQQGDLRERAQFVREAHANIRKESRNRVRTALDGGEYIPVQFVSLNSETTELAMLAMRGFLQTEHCESSRYYEDVQQLVAGFDTLRREQIILSE